MNYAKHGGKKPGESVGGNLRRKLQAALVSSRKQAVWTFSFEERTRCRRTRSFYLATPPPGTPGMDESINVHFV